MSIVLSAAALVADIMLGAFLIALLTVISIAATPWRDGDLDADFDSHTGDRFTGFRRHVYLYSRKRSRAKLQRNAAAAAAHHAAAGRTEHD